MKNKKIFVTILLLLGILLLISGIILIYLSGAKTDVSKSDNMSTKIKSLLKNDYIVSNLIYGTPKVKNIPNVTIDNFEYKLVDDDNITGIESLHKIINNTYSDDLFTDSIVDFNKYNKYVEVENKLYVNINSKCSIDKFDDKVSIVNETDDIITVKNNNRQVTISKDGGIYKLKKSAYICK